MEAMTPFPLLEPTRIGMELGKFPGLELIGPASQAPNRCSRFFSKLRRHIAESVVHPS